MHRPRLGAVQAQFDRLLDYTADKLSEVTNHLDQARADILASTQFPLGVWQQIWSNNPTERLNREMPTPHRQRRHLPQQSCGPSDQVGAADNSRGVGGCGAHPA